MLLALTAAGLVASVAASPSPARPGALTQLRSRPGDASPDLRIRPWSDAPAATVAARTVPGRAEGMPPCIADVCQPRVSVPGYEPRYEQVSRTELTLSYLDRVRLEPFATIAWALLVTGLRFDYSPPVADGASPAPQGWGTVFVRVRFRMDADNVPVVPKRPRDNRPPPHGTS